MAGTSASKRSSTKRKAAPPVVASSEETNTSLTAKDAVEALSGGDAASLASVFRGLIRSEAVRGGPQHVCLKRAFALLESRWKVDQADNAIATSGGQEPLVFGKCFPPQLFVSVMALLDPRQAMRSGRTCKDWWRHVSTLPEATHIDLTTLRSRKSTNFWGSPWRGMMVREGPKEPPSGLGWQDLLDHLRHIKKTNPRRVVRRLTFDSKQKLGSLSNLSSATVGLLTHIDFSRNRREVDFDELATNLPGLRGLGLDRTFYGTGGSEEWIKSLAKLMSTVSLESLRVCAWQCRSLGRVSRLEDSSLVALAGGGDALLRLMLVAGSSQGADVEEGMSALGAAAPRLQVLTIDQLRVTNKGWEKFGRARIETKRHLVSIRIKAAGEAYVPSKMVRALLLGAVTESLLLCGKASTLVDCDRSPVTVPEAPGRKLNVVSSGPWWSIHSLKATDL